MLRGISLYDRGNKVWWQRSDLDGLHYVVDFSHRAGRSKLALHFANLGLRVYEPNRQAPEDGQVGFSNVAVRCGDGAGLLPVIATLLLGGRFKNRPNPKAPSPREFGRTRFAISSNVTRIHEERGFGGEEQEAFQ